MKERERVCVSHIPGERLLSEGIVYTVKFGGVGIMVLDESRSFFRVHTGYFSNIRSQARCSKPLLQKLRRSTIRGAPGEDPLKWLKEYDRVANFNKWDDMMCLANVYFFLDDTARQWYVNNEYALDSWEAFKHGLSGIFGDRQKYNRRAEEQLKCEPSAQGRAHKEIVQDKVERVSPQCQQNLQKPRPRPTYAAVTRKSRASVQRFSPQPRKTDVWRTADNRSIYFHCGRLGHVMRYCRERKAVFDNYRNHRQNTEEEIRRPHSAHRSTPSPTRGRSPIRRFRSPSPYRRSSQSPSRRREET
ncbi:CCHC-type domain-containing protein [Trichonephila clavipes]|nr:CCHC-type domain-containing protein [Trichonephila clavipes]